MSDNKKDDDKKDPVGRKGGLGRRNALTPQELKAIAQRGAAARWGKPLVATNKGNFLEHFGVDVDCYVLNDATRTAVISQRGMGKALGLTERGNALPRFISSKTVAEAVGAELGEKLRNPLKFQWGSGGAEQPPTEVNGFDATVLIDLCKAIISASVAGNFTNAKVVRQASIIITASAKNGIRGLVYALAGYSPTDDEVIQAFKLYVQEEAKKYEKEFPQDLYEQWHRLYQIPVPIRGKPWQFKHLTVNHIYMPLAKSNGRILELLRALKARGGDGRKKLFQFLNEVGARALRIQIGRVLEMSESSEQRVEYEGKIVARFGGQHEIDFTPPTTSPNEPQPPSSQSPPAVSSSGTPP